MATYYGATAASSLANPPVQISGGFTRPVDSGSTGGNLPRGAALWFFSSSANSTEVSAANFISDAYYLGMRPGDVVLGSYQSSAGSTTGNSYRLWCSGVTTAGASFSTGQMSTG